MVLTLTCVNLDNENSAYLFQACGNNSESYKSQPNCSHLHLVNGFNYNIFHQAIFCQPKLKPVLCYFVQKWINKMTPGKPNYSDLKKNES